jgi:hypothetical protein
MMAYLSSAQFQSMGKVASRQIPYHPPVGQALVFFGGFMGIGQMACFLACVFDTMLLFFGWDVGSVPVREGLK